MKNRIVYILAVVIVGVLAFIVVNSISSKYYLSNDYRWHGELTSNEKNLLVRGKKIDRIKNDLDKLIYAVNESNQDPETFRTPENIEPIGSPKLKLIEVKDEVAIVEIINATYLTQRMGSTGADVFLAEATFTLTEYKNIKFINFLFEVGDHATPGLYSRKDFLNHWEPIE
ncbi:MAG: hypothetical protein WBB69_16325 [Anaerolineales bacterium]